MLSNLIAITVALALPAAIVSIAFALSYRRSDDREKASPFECGFDPKSSSRLPFSLRFFLLAVLFLVFDIEIVLLLPAPFTLNFSSPIYTLMPFLCFIVILILGLFHEWNEGSLDWSKY